MKGLSQGVMSGVITGVEVVFIDVSLLRTIGESEGLIVGVSGGKSKGEERKKL